MKKTCVLLCLITMLGTTVSATDINVDVSLRKVKVTASDTLIAEKPTLQVLDKNKTKAIYTAEGIFSGEEYLFETFSMGLDAASDTYIVRIGENGQITEKEFYYASYNEIIAALNMADSETVTSQGMVDSYAKLLGVDETSFKNLPVAWKNRITNEIKNLTIDTTTDEGVKNGIEALIKVFDKWFDYSTLALSGDVSAIDKAVKKVSGLDLKYYDNLTDKKHISEAFSACGFNPETVTEAELSNLFDGALVTGVIIQNDWATGKEAVNYYENKGLFDVDSKYLNAEATVYKALKQKNIKDYTKIPDTLKSLYGNGLPQGSGNSGGTGGGGGSSTGGKTINDTISINSIASPAGVGSSNTQNNVQTPKFTDISNVPWATEAIDAFSKAGILAGRGNGIFAPNDTMTRAEFVKVVVLALGLVDNNAMVSFEDVPKNAWHYKYIASAKNAGIINGMSDTYFGTDESISREDMAVIAARLTERFKITMTGTEIEFLDKNEISDYAYSAVMKLSGTGIINGMGDGTFSPKSYVTRAQGAKVIYDIASRRETDR